jgi:hypothetical protein
MRLFCTALSLTLATLTLVGCQPRLQPQSSTPGANLPPTQINAQSVDSIIDDSDLSGGFRPQSAARLDNEALQTLGDLRIFGTQTVQAPAPLNRQDLTVSGTLTFVDRKGQTKPAAMAKVSLLNTQGQVVNSAETRADGSWQVSVATPGSYSVRYTLENRYWNLKNYAWQGPVAEVSGAMSVGVTQLSPDTENAKAAWIHDIYLQSMALFTRENVPLGWWTRQIQTVWPGRGNYYISDTVNLTGAEQWDVNGHEIGHAIYHQALNAASRGGQHKIDECYHDTLALSEGFASFFSAAVQLERNDPDARFDQYLVPRRAPIRIENVPEDVCAGPANEWRVSSVFWDIYDSHDDGGENLSLGLRTIFEALGRQNRPTANSVMDAYGLLKEVTSAAQHAQLAQAFRQNTMLVNP